MNNETLNWREIGARMKQARRERTGWKPVPLANALGLGRMGIYDMEVGKGAQPKKLAKVCDFLKINRRWAETGEGVMMEGEAPAAPDPEEPKPRKQPSGLCAALRRATEAVEQFEAARQELAAAIAEVNQHSLAWDSNAFNFLLPLPSAAEGSGTRVASAVQGNGCEYEAGVAARSLL